MSAAGAGPPAREARPVADGLFEWPSEEPRLLAGRCRGCDTWVFPTPDACPHCSGVDIEQQPLPREGRLWSYTVQRFRPKTPYDGPDDFEPYAVGYVDFEDRVIVEGRLTTTDESRLKIGAPFEVCVIPYTTAEDGVAVLTFAFRPMTS